MENNENQTSQSVNTAAPVQNPQTSPSGHADNQTLLSILAYLGPLVLVSLYLGKSEPFVKFHVKQGLVVFSMEVIVWILGMIVWPLWMFWSLIDLFAFVLSVIGIVNVLQKKEKELPVVGKFSSHFPV